MDTNITERYTEIYVNGGGNWLTESYATNFHHFYKRKMLTASEDIDDFKEVTEAEKTALEAADAKWEKPTEALIELWNFAWSRNPNWTPFGKYNPDTGFFEGNGILDITTSQARIILDVGHLNDRVTEISGAQYVYRLPTVLPIYTGGSLRSVPSVCSIDTIRIVNYYIINNGKDPDTTPMAITNTRDLGYISGISHVLGILDVSKDAASRHLYNGMNSVETIWLMNICKGVNLQAAKSLRLDCLKFMVENAQVVANGQTITLHPTIYAKIIDEENEEWNALLDLAQEKNITFTTV